MLKFALVVALGQFVISFCKSHSKDEAFPLHDIAQENNNVYSSMFPSVTLPCRNFPTCLLIDRNKSFKGTYKPQVLSAVQDYERQQRSLIQGRSYYNSFPAPATPAYYPTFDPISVLASLAFLAFLLQSFSSLYDRSRSILPSIISGREASPEITMSGITKRVLRALDEYESLNNDLIQSRGNKEGLS